MISKFASQIFIHEVLWTHGQERSERMLLTLKGKYDEIFFSLFRRLSETSLRIKDDFKICFTNFYNFSKFVMRFDVKNS